MSSIARIIKLNFFQRCRLKQKSQVKEITKELRELCNDFVSEKKMKITVLPVGYSNGLDKKAWQCRTCLDKKKKAGIVGRVCMNMMVVNIALLLAWHRKMKWS